MTTSLKLHILPICAVSAVQLFVASNAAAQVVISGYSLPLNLANEAAIEAVRTCEASGYAVSVAVVDASGLVKVQLKGDHSTVHTKDTSFRRAYTLVTMGPVLGLGSGSEFADFSRSNSNASARQQTIPAVVSPGLTFRRNRCHALARPLDSPPPAVANVATEARISCPVTRPRLRPALRAV